MSVLLLFRCCCAPRNDDCAEVSCASRSAGESPMRWNAKTAAIRFATRRMPRPARTCVFGSRRLMDDRLEFLIIGHRQVEANERVILRGRYLRALADTAKHVRLLQIYNETDEWLRCI